MTTFAEKIAAARGRGSNGEAVTSPNTEGLAPMEPMTEETEPTRDQGLPPLDLANLPALEASNFERDDRLSLEHVEELLSKIMNREDRLTTIRTEAEKAEDGLRTKAVALESAEAAVREATTNRIVAERMDPGELAAAKHREDRAILDLSNARTDHAHEARAVEALRDRLGVDHSLDEALAEGRAAVDALLAHERGCAADRISNELKLAASKIVTALTILRDLIGAGKIVSQGVELDAAMIKTLLAWAGAGNPEMFPGTRRLLDIAGYVKRQPGTVADPELRLRGFHFQYEESRGADAPRSLWRPGEKLVLRNPRQASVGIRFEGSDEEVYLPPGQVKDCTALGVPTIASRQMIDEGMLELVPAR